MKTIEDFTSHIQIPDVLGCVLSFVHTLTRTRYVIPENDDAQYHLPVVSGIMMVYSSSVIMSASSISRLENDTTAMVPDG